MSNGRPTTDIHKSSSTSVRLLIEDNILTVQCLLAISNIVIIDNVDLRPKVKDHYRADKMALWSKLIPELMSNGNGKVFTVGTENEDDGEVVTGGEGL